MIVAFPSFWGGGGRFSPSISGYLDSGRACPAGVGSLLVPFLRGCHPLFVFLGASASCIVCLLGFAPLE